MRKIRSNKKGITLVALVVTIVILLILAGITLSLVLGNNGIIAKATDASTKTKQAKDDETLDLESLDSSVDDALGILPSTNETMPYLPTGCSRLRGTNLDTGLVIQDSKENQYVWVEVPKTAEVYQKSGLSITDFTSDEYDNIDYDLYMYIREYREKINSGFYDKWYPTDQTALPSDQYNKLKKKMLKSIYQNGGFWIGRYETGDGTSTADNTVRTAESGISGEAVIKEGQQPYNFVTYNQSETLAQNINPDSSNYCTSMPFGIQCDLIIKYLETKGVSKPELKSNSSSWGNYQTASFEITKGKFLNNGSWNMVNNKYTKELDDDVLLTTGATDRNSKQGIYDLVGNVNEMTLEYSGISGSPYTMRGGTCYDDGFSYPATSRCCYYGTDNTGEYNRFSSCTLLKKT